MNLRKNALYSAKRKYEVKQKDEIATIRRNLLFVSLLSIASLVVSPKNGEYSINLGVISGAIRDPEFVFFGLLIICGYQLYHFYINAHEAIFNSINFTEINKIYMYALASEVARREWYDLARHHKAPDSKVVTGSFNRYNAEKHKDLYTVYIKIPKMPLDSEPDFLNALSSSERFEVKEDRGLYDIRYSYPPTGEDYLYLSQHRSQFILSKHKDFIEYALPCACGVLAIIALAYKAITIHIDGV